MSFTGCFRLGEVSGGLFRAGVFVRDLDPTGDFLTAIRMDATGSIVRTQTVPACAPDDASGPYHPVLDGSTRVLFPDGRERWVRSGLDGVAVNMAAMSATDATYQKVFADSLLAVIRGKIASGAGGGRGGGGGGGGGGDRAAWGSPGSGGNGWPGNSGSFAITTIQPAWSVKRVSPGKEIHVTIGAAGQGGVGGNGGARGNNADTLKSGSDGTDGTPGSPGGKTIVNDGIAEYVASNSSSSAYNDILETGMSYVFDGITYTAYYGGLGYGGGADTTTRHAFYNGNVGVRVGSGSKASPSEVSRTTISHPAWLFSTSDDWGPLLSPLPGIGGTAGSGGLSGEDDTLYISNKEPTAGGSGGSGGGGESGRAWLEIIEWNILS